jgi:hypothetical protein
MLKSLENIEGTLNRGDIVATSQTTFIFIG